MITELVPLLVPLVSITITMAIPIVWIVLNYRKRLRLMELHHRERMAAIERGMELPPLPLELIDGRSGRRRRSSLLPGLVWFFIGLAGVVGSISVGEEVSTAFALVPLGVGLAYLIYYFFEGRRVEARQLEHDLQRERGDNRFSQGPMTL